MSRTIPLLPLCGCIAYYSGDLYLYCTGFQKEDLVPEHKRMTTTCSKKATQHLFILKTFGQFWWCNQKFQDSVGNEIYHAFASDSRFSPFQTVSFRVYARGPAFLPSMKPTVLESHVGRSAILPIFPGTRWKQCACPLNFIPRNKRESQRASRQVSEEAQWPQLGTIVHALHLHNKFPCITATATSWHENINLTSNGVLVLSAPWQTYWKYKYHVTKLYLKHVQAPLWLQNSRLFCFLQSH